MEQVLITGASRGLGAPLSQEESAAGMARVLDGLDLDRTGEFLNWQGKTMPW